MIDEPPDTEAYRRRVGSEVYYLEHYEEIERRYQQWCSDRHKDPENVGSMVEYEEQYGQPL